MLFEFMNTPIGRTPRIIDKRKIMHAEFTMAQPIQCPICFRLFSNSNKSIFELVFWAAIDRHDSNCDRNQNVSTWNHQNDTRTTRQKGEQLKNHHMQIEISPMNIDLVLLLFSMASQFKRQKTRVCGCVKFTITSILVSFSRLEIKRRKIRKTFYALETN